MYQKVQKPFIFYHALIDNGETKVIVSSYMVMIDQ